MSFVGRFLRAGDHETLFGRGYDAQFHQDSHEPRRVSDDGVDVWRDVSYDPSAPEDRLRQLDLYRPSAVATDALLPVFLFLHGGGWRAGDRDDASNVYENLSIEIARRGWAVANANTRLAPKADWRTQASDLARAIAFLSQGGSGYGLDGRIVIAGHSSGGHLVSLVALDRQWLRAEDVAEDAVRGVVPISGVFDIFDFAQSPSNLTWMVKPAFGTDEREWADASPISWASPEAPPFYIVVGQDDEAHIAEQARRLDALLDESGVISAVAEMPDADHFSILSRVGEQGYPLVDDVATFADTVAGGLRAERDWDEAVDALDVEG